MVCRLDVANLAARCRGQSTLFLVCLPAGAAARHITYCPSKVAEHCCCLLVSAHHQKRVAVEQDEHVVVDKQQHAGLLRQTLIAVPQLFRWPALSQ